jgi:hypothetical protein
LNTSPQLPIAPEKLFSTHSHFHIKKALKHQYDFLQLAKQGNKEAIILRNAIMATMVAVKMSKTEAMILRYYLSGIHSREVMAILLDDNKEFTIEKRTEYLKLKKEFVDLNKKKEKNGEDNLRIAELDKGIKAYQENVNIIANQLLDRMMKTFHDIMAS